MFEFAGVGIRAIEERDLLPMLRLRSDPRVWPNLGTLGILNDQQQRLWYESLSIAKDRAYYVLYSSDPTAIDFLGYVRFDEIDCINRNMRVGGDILPEHQGQGYGTRMFQLIKKYAFDYLDLYRLWLLVLDYNQIAINLYKKVGFVEEGRYREAIYRNGKRHDYIVMSILRREYENERNSSF